MIRDQIDYTELTKKTIKFVKSIAAESFQVPRKQVPRVLFHGLILAFIIAGFWLVDSLKDPVLSITVGIEYQPIAKLLSVISTLIVVCVYDFLTSVVTKPALFHIIAAVFGVIMMMISAMLSDLNFRSGGHIDKGPHQLLGWGAYFCIEAYGSLMTALFWSFTNSIMDLEQAKGAYGLIIAIAQIGAILGSTLATNAGSIGIPSLFIFGAILIFSVSLLIKTYHITYRDYVTESIRSRVRSISESDSVEALLPSVSETNHAADIPTNTKTSMLQYLSQVFSGFYEGLSLIIRHSYVLKLLGVSCLYEIVVTILDFEFKMMGAHASTVAAIKSAQLQGLEGSDSAQDHFANLLGHFGQLTNLVSFCMSCFGFSYLVHHIGVDKSLLIFPSFLFFAVIVTYLVPKLWVLFVFVSILKGLIFSLHDPVKELLYIPTSESIKFKAKAWIDVFGSRFAKAAGSVITSLAVGDPNKLHSYAEIPALVLTSLIIVLTFTMGRDFVKLVESNSIIGEPEGKLRYEVDLDGPIMHGLNPGDVGYSGYDLKLFEGVFDEEEFVPVHESNKLEVVDLSEGDKVGGKIEPVHIDNARQMNRVRTKSAHI